MKFKVYTQKNGMPRTYSFSFRIKDARESEIKEVLKIEHFFNELTDVRVHIEQEFEDDEEFASAVGVATGIRWEKITKEEIEEKWTKENQEQAENRINRKKE